MSRFDGLFAPCLETVRSQGMLRQIRPVRPAGPGRVWREGRLLLNFSANDYLGLAHHPALVAGACRWAERWGAGSGASRLVCGTIEPLAALEARIARLKGTEAALVLVSGWQTNAAVLPALFQRDLYGADPLVFTDRLNHASLHHGCQAAGVRQIRFRHNDLDHLERLLARHSHQPGPRFILTESVFSMDGDQVALPALADLAERHGAFLYLDEAHATGVLGPHGMGLSGLVPGRVDLIMGTFSKALGGFGAYVACSAVLRDYLVQRVSGLIYATALPPAVLGAIDAALDLVPTLDQARHHLHHQADRLRAALAGAGIDTGASSTQIVPALIGEAGAALAVSEALERAGLLAIAIRPPTVPPGTSRIRFALSTAHSAEDIDQLIALACPLLAQCRSLKTERPNQDEAAP